MRNLLSPNLRPVMKDEIEYRLQSQNYYLVLCKKDEDTLYAPNTLLVMSVTPTVDQNDKSFETILFQSFKGQGSIMLKSLESYKDKYIFFELPDVKLNFDMKAVRFVSEENLRRYDGSMCVLKDGSYGFIAEDKAGPRILGNYPENKQLSDIVAVISAYELIHTFNGKQEVIFSRSSA